MSREQHNHSLKEHVEVLSSHLQRRHDLTVEPLAGCSDGTVLLKNEFVKFRIFPGWPKDPYVEVSVYFADPDVLLSEKYFELWRYIDYVDGWEYFPIRFPKGRATKIGDFNRNYLFVGSPFLVQEVVAFLTAHGEPIFEVDKEKIHEFMAWSAQKNREYNERMSRKRD